MMGLLAASEVAAGVASVGIATEKYITIYRRGEALNKLQI
jgi:hypothetical protein